MDIYPLVRKCLVVGIILLFVGTNIIPMTAQDGEKPSLLTSKGYWLYVGGNGPGNYTTIQSAIEAASPGDTIFVYSGTYNESIIINKKQLTLIGQDKNTTLINFDPNYQISQITINANNCSIENLQIVILGNHSVIPQGIIINSNYNTIKNNIIINVTDGIDLSESESNTIIHNEIKNNSIGIDASGSTYNNISKNVFSNNAHYNIFLSTGSDNNNVSSNMMNTSEFGMSIAGCKYNKVYRNCIQNNQIGISCCCYGWSNYFYNNNFLNNSINAKNDYGLTNIWYDHPTRTGNYWDDYTGLDANGDGIGDTPYKIYGGDMEDRYPLMEPLMNQPPNTPTITGETNGDILTSYNYTIQAADPEQDDVQYHIDWGDNTITITGLNESGEKIIVSHTWDIKGTYNVKVAAIDKYGAESEWATLTVKMPCSFNILFTHFWIKLFERFPHAFLLLRQLLRY